MEATTRARCQLDNTQISSVCASTHLKISSAFFREPVQFAKSDAIANSGIEEDRQIECHCYSRGNLSPSPQTGTIPSDISAGSRSSRVFDFFLGRTYGAFGIVTGSLLVGLTTGLPLGTYTFLKYRRIWHAQCPPCSRLQCRRITGRSILISLFRRYWIKYPTMRECS